MSNIFWNKAEHSGQRVRTRRGRKVGVKKKLVFLPNYVQVCGYFTWGSTKILRNCYPENNELEARVYICVHVLKTGSR